MTLSIEQSQRIRDIAYRLQSNDGESILILLAELEKAEKSMEFQREVSHRTIDELVEERNRYRNGLQTIIEIQTGINEGKNETRDITSIARETMKLSSQAYETTRYFWENKILEAADRVPIDSNKSDWIYRGEFDSFVDAWYDLKRFYESHVDAEIGVRVVIEYIAYTRLLRRIMLDNAVEEQIRADAKEKLEALESSAEYTLWEAGANIGD